MRDQRVRNTDAPAAAARPTSKRPASTMQEKTLAHRRDCAPMRASSWSPPGSAAAACGGEGFGFGLGLGWFGLRNPPSPSEAMHCSQPRLQPYKRGLGSAPGARRPGRSAPRRRAGPAARRAT